MSSWNPGKCNFSTRPRFKAGDVRQVVNNACADVDSSEVHAVRAGECRGIEHGDDRVLRCSRDEAVIWERVSQVISGPCRSDRPGGAEPSRREAGFSACKFLSTLLHLPDLNIDLDLNLRHRIHMSATNTMSKKVPGTNAAPLTPFQSPASRRRTSSALILHRPISSSCIQHRTCHSRLDNCARIC